MADSNIYDFQEVTGLAAIDLGVTGAPGTNTTAAPSSGNKTLPQRYSIRVQP